MHKEFAGGEWGCNIQITSLIRIKALTSLNIQTNIVIYSTLLSENIMQYNLLSAGFPMDTNCVPLLDDPIFIFSEAEFIPKLLHEKKSLSVAFNSTFMEYDLRQINMHED